MKLVIGLGNPGREYAGTRHNIGFDVVERMAERLGLTFAPGEFDRLAKGKFDGLAMDGNLSLPGGASEKVLLLKPLTYMNLSGKSVNQAMAFYQLSPKEIMVVLDDLALPCGKIRLRAGGSSGGHNGLKNIELVLATSDYPRLRLGIDAPPGRVPGRDYVLGRFSEDQRAAIEPAINRSVKAIQLWIESGIESAMNRFNADVEK
jgi:PTH1 family peptidyl-tRNA hydrolase